MVKTAGQARDLLEFAIEADGVALQGRDVGIGVQRVEAARRMPRRARCQVRALDEHDIGPAELRQVVEDTASDNAAADDGHTHVGAHRAAIPERRRNCPG